MAGNVSEWVADWYAEDTYESSPSQNATGASSGESRVLRGGSWLDERYSVRGANRIGATPDTAYYVHGFRCASSQESISDG